VFPPGIKVKIWIKSKQKRRETNDVAVRMLLENTFSHPKCAPVPFVAVSLTIREFFFLKNTVAHVVLNFTNMRKTLGV